MYDICTVRAKETMAVVRVIYLKMVTLIVMEIIRMFVQSMGIINLSWKQQIILLLTLQNLDVQCNFFFVFFILQHSVCKHANKKYYIGFSSSQMWNNSNIDVSCCVELNVYVAPFIHNFFLHWDTLLWRHVSDLYWSIFRSHITSQITLLQCYYL
jgi:hypothetical protein